jgi:hypothetical protein
MSTRHRLGGLIVMLALGGAHAQDVPSPVNEPYPGVLEL